MILSAKEIGPASAILDPSALNRLRSLLGKKADVMLPKLMDDFFLDAVKLQARAEQALKEGNAEDLRRAAHTLKSNAKNFGATGMADICQEIENRAKEGSTDVSDWLERIRTGYPEVRSALEILRGDP